RLDSLPIPALMPARHYAPKAGLDNICRLRHNQRMADTSDNEPQVKQLHFQGSALNDLKVMPDEVRRRFGYALWELQNSVTPPNASPFELSTANEVMKLTERYIGDTYRCVYAAKFEKAVYVLHVFQKKSTSGIATPK